MLMRMDMLKVGDYAKFVGHKAQDHYKRDWWKVTQVTNDAILLIDRTGATGRLPRNKRYQDLRANRWEPGDPK